MSNNQQATPAQSVLLSALARILSQASDGYQTYDQLIQLATQANNTDLVTFLQQVKQEDGDRVKKALAILAGTLDWGVPDSLN